MANTREKLLDISISLMMSKGYNATSIEEICKLAEVTKGAFFYYFKTKEDLGVAVLNEYWQMRQRQFAGTNWMQAGQALEQIQAFLQVVAEVFMNDPKGYSCLAGSFSQELASTNPLFQTMVKDLFAEWAQQVKPLLASAQSTAHHAQALNIDELTDYIIVVIEGSLILAQARQNPRIIAQNVRILSDYLASLFQDQI